MLKSIISRSMTKKSFLVSFLLIFAIVIGTFQFVMAVSGAGYSDISDLNISIDTTFDGGTGDYTILSDFVITEVSAGDIGQGTHTFGLANPNRFEFKSDSDGLNVTITTTAGEITIFNNQVIVTSNSITFTTTSESTSPDVITISGLEIRPKTQTLGSDSLKYTNNIINGIDYKETVATFETVAGEPTDVYPEDDPEGNGDYIDSTTYLTANEDNLDIYAITRDQFGNFVENAAAVVWFTSEEGGGFDSDEMVVDPDLKSVIYSPTTVGTGRISPIVAGMELNQTGILQTKLNSPGTPEAIDGELDDDFINAEEGEQFFVEVDISSTGAIEGYYVELLLSSGSFSTPKIIILDEDDLINGSVEYKVNATDLGSDGIKSLSSKISGNAPGGTDWQTSGNLIFTLDTTPPDVDAGGYIGDKYNVFNHSGVVTDSGSGVLVTVWEQTSERGTVAFDDEESLNVDMEADQLGYYEVTLNAADNAGNIAEDTMTFNWVERPELFVTNVTPAAGTENVSIESGMAEFKFNTTIHASAGIAEKIDVIDSEGNSKIGNATIHPEDDTTLVLLYTDLEPNTTYKVIVEENALYGYINEEETEIDYNSYEFFTFTTESNDDQNPYITYHPDSTNHPVNGQIMMIFNEPMDPLSFNDSTIQLRYYDGDTFIPSIVSIDNDFVFIYPVEDLRYDTRYYIYVDGVKDLSGNTADINDWQEGVYFTTEPEPDMELQVTNISTINSYAMATDEWDDGWKWKFDITVPTDETEFKFKFDDWQNQVGDILETADNVRYYTEEGNYYDSDHAVLITESSDYPAEEIILDGDLNLSTPGRQIELYVEVKLPEGSSGGSYSTQYGIESLLTIDE